MYFVSQALQLARKGVRMDAPHLYIPAAVALSTLLPGVDYVATLRARAPGGGADDYGVASVTLRVAKDGVAARIAGA